MAISFWDTITDHFHPNYLFPRKGNRQGIEDKSNPIAVEFFEFLARLAPRFEDLEFVMSLSLYRILESMIDVTTVTNLRSLRARISTDRYQDNTKSISLFKAPNLKAISAKFPSAITSQLLGITDPSKVSTWRKVTDFLCHSYLNPSDLISLLEHMPNLVHFNGRITARYHDIDYEPRATLKSISLPFLRTFSIVDNITPRGKWNHKIYNRIDARGITWANYGGTLEPSPDDDQEDSSIAALLKRLPALKKLSINTHMFWGQEEELARIFKATPSITHLFLGYEERDLAGRLVRVGKHRTTSDDTQLGFESDDASGFFELQSLIVPPNVDTNKNIPLLPNLKSLEQSNRIADVTDEHLVKVITSRIQTPSSSTPVVAQLRHVAVVFYRVKSELDVEAAIKDHATRVGADMIDLSLDYPAGEPPFKMVEPHDPRYGLNFEGRSWNHQDATEFSCKDLY